MATSMKLGRLMYLSNPAIVCSAGENMEDIFKTFYAKKSSLVKDEEFVGKPIYIGKISSPLAPFHKTSKHFNTRTNQILLTALLQIDTKIQKAIKKYGKDRIGVVIGTTTTGIEENFFLFKHEAKTSMWDLDLYSNERQNLSNPADFIKDFYALRSVSYGISTACTSGAKALIHAKRLIEKDICDCVICGGVDSINTLTINGFNSLGLLSQNISNPLSKNRDGINIGEGAALFLASKDKISDVLLCSYGTNCDAYHITQPDVSAKMPIFAIEKALKKAGLESVDYINLHATGTLANDTMESLAFFKTLPLVKASSTKPFMGHTLGAAGAIEAGICHGLITKGHTKLPPHLYDGKYDESLESISLADDGVREVNSALSSSFAFGGDNAILVLRRDDGV